MNATPTSTPLIHKLESILALSEDEKHVLRKLSGTIKSVGPRQDLVREGDRPSECCLILEGFAYRYKQTAFVYRPWLPLRGSCVLGPEDRQPGLAC